MHSATGNTLDQLIILNLNFHHRIDGNACVIHGLSLRDGSREAVEEKAVCAVVSLNAFFDQINDDVIRD